MDHGLELAVNKTETAMITKRRAYRALWLDIGGYPVLLKKLVKYMGVTFDSRLSFVRHMTEVEGRALKMATAVGRVMNNLGDSKMTKRMLLSTVVNSKLMYATPIWAAQGRKYACNRGALQKAQ